MKQKHWQVSVFDKTSQIIRDDTFYTTDTENYLIFELIDNHFTPDTATVTVYNVNGKVTINVNVDVSGGIVRYEIPEEAIVHGGVWRTQVIFTEDDEDYTTGIINFDVSGHLLDNSKAKLVTITNWNRFIKYAEELIDDWEQLEEIRQANERQRELAEKKRHNEFKKNETERQTEFEANETSRQANEQGRESAESVRVANEEERISKDSERNSKIETLEEQFQNVIDETTDKDVISAPELIAARNGKSNLKTRLDDEHAEVTAQLQQTEQELTAQLAHITTCSSLKMIPNNVDEGVNNYNKLLSAMQLGKKIIVDNIYYLNTNGTKQYIEHDVMFEGIKNNKLILASDGVYWHNKKSIDLKGVVFEKTSGSATLFSNDTNDLIEKVQADGCTTIGNVAMFSCNRTTFSPSINKIKVINLSKNEIISADVVWFLLNDLDYDRFYVNGNHVTNMSKQIINVTGNLNTKAITEIDGNIVENDFDFWKPTTSYYLCFVLFATAGKLYYRNNKVSGLKSTFDNCSVYDAYLSADWVEYENNIWQDNLRVSSVLGYNVLFKGKDGSTSDSKLYRSYRNNKFVMSQEMINQLTPTQLSYVNLILAQYVDDLSDFIVENNYIDVYKLTGVSTATDITNLSFNNNTIKCKYINGDLLKHYPKTENVAVVSINNNTILSEDDTNNSKLLSFASAATAYVRDLTINNNTFVGSFDYLLYHIDARKMQMNNNNFKSLKSGKIDLMHQCNVDLLTGDNNSLESNDDIGLFRATTYIKEMNYSLNPKRKTYTYANSSLNIPIEDSKTKKITHKIEYMNGTEFCSFWINFEVGIDTTGVYIKYKNTTGSTVTEYSGASKPLYLEKINAFTTAITYVAYMDYANNFVQLRITYPNEQSSIKENIRVVA